MNRRTFLGHGAALGAATLGPVGAAAVADAGVTMSTTAPSAGLTATGTLGPTWASGPKSHWVPLVQTGWNIYATRFMNPPTFTWKPLAGAAAYVVQSALATDKSARTVRLDSPAYDMANDWAGLKPSCIDMIAWAVDGQDRMLSVAWRKRFWKTGGARAVHVLPSDGVPHGALARVAARPASRDGQPGVPGQGHRRRKRHRAGAGPAERGVFHVGLRQTIQEVTADASIGPGATPWPWRGWCNSCRI